MCGPCFQHVREFHPHRRFIAYDPPQKDVFGNWKQAKGKEVLVQDETPNGGETPKKEETDKKEEPISVETPTKEETPTKDETPKKEETPTEKETPTKEETPKEETSKEETPTKEETPKKEETPVSQPPITEESWKTVKEKPRKSRNSGTVEMEGRKKSPTLPKLNYKKIIQKSLKPAEPIPAVITGPAPPAVPATSASPASPASSASPAAPSSTPQNETPKAKSQLFSETPGRFVVTVPAEKAAEFEKTMGDDAKLIGEVTNSHWLEAHLADAEINQNVTELQKLWEEAIPCQLKSKD